MKRVIPEQRHTCPRRAEDGMDSEDSPFVLAGKNLDYYGADNVCHYCGSLNGEEFVRRLEAGDVQLQPTSKNYKVYVTNDGGEPFKQEYHETVEGAGKHSVDECDHWSVRDMNTTKFYFVHLNEEQRIKFIMLLNEKKIKFAHPGYFDPLPFFIQR